MSIFFAADLTEVFGVVTLSEYRDSDEFENPFWLEIPTDDGAIQLNMASVGAVEDLADAIRQAAQSYRASFESQP